MARPLIFNNGELAVGLDKFGSVRDFYFPFGENHVSENISRWKIGVFVNDEISWLDSGEWKISTEYYDRRGIPRMLGKISAKNERLNIALEIDDFVDFKLNIFSRNFHVINMGCRRRLVKLFTHQIFRISEAGDGHDTVQWIPNQKLALFTDGKSKSFSQIGDVICHYKNKRVFMVGGKNLQNKSGFDSFTTGNYGDFGGISRDGSWRDAENGRLAKNPAERIATDSVLEFAFKIDAHDSARANYFVAAGETFSETTAALSEFNKTALSTRFSQNEDFWREWIQPVVNFAEAKIAVDFRELFLKSALIAKTHISRNGAIIAALDSGMLRTTRDAYVDCWPRDSANVLSAFLEMEMFDELKNFFDFAKTALTPQGFFWQMYFANGAVGPNSHAFIDDGNGDFLLPIQTDETAATLLLLAKTLNRISRNAKKIAKFREYYEDLAVKMANFLCEYTDKNGLPKPSYELWEVRLETTTYTTGLTIAALTEIAQFAKNFGDHHNFVKWSMATSKMRSASKKFWNPSRNYFYRGFYLDGTADETIDIASLRGAELGRFENVDTAFKTFCARFNVSEAQTKAPRFENDDYHGFENPWFISGFWLAESRFSETGFAKSILDSAKKYAKENSLLPEQISDDNAPIEPLPLAWSHGEFMSAAIKFSEKKQ